MYGTILLSCDSTSRCIGSIVSDHLIFAPIIETYLDLLRAIPSWARANFLNLGRRRCCVFLLWLERCDVLMCIG